MIGTDLASRQAVGHEVEGLVQRGSGQLSQMLWLQRAQAQLKETAGELRHYTEQYDAQAAKLESQATEIGRLGEQLAEARRCVEEQQLQLGALQAELSCKGQEADEWQSKVPYLLPQRRHHPLALLWPARPGFCCPACCGGMGWLSEWLPLRGPGDRPAVGGRQPEVHHRAVQHNPRRDQQGGRRSSARSAALCPAPGRT